MGTKSKKRGRELIQVDENTDISAKRRRQINEGDFNLSKLYEDLAAESDDVRLQAAKEIILKFSPGNEPAAEEVGKALNRLIRGMCSQRKAARLGYCVTLTELLRQLLGQNNTRIKGLELNVDSVIAMIEEKTKLEGKVPGQGRRDHLIGKLFGYKAVIQSSILVEPVPSLQCWTKLLDHVCGMARDVPWLREECGLVLIEALKSLNSKPEFQDYARVLLQRLSSLNLVYTPEGVAIWLTLRAQYKTVLPGNIWHHNDPLSKKERVRLAKILKEDFRNISEDHKDEGIKSAAANPNPVFAWNLVLSEALKRDESSRDEGPRSEFPQFWIDVVDNNLFASSSSHERKSWGLKLFASMIVQVPDWAIAALFSPNFMRTLINQSKKDNRFLHAAALAAFKALQHRVERQPGSASSIFISLTSKSGTIELDKITRTKTLEQLLLLADDKALEEIVRHLNSLVLRPESQDQDAANTRRQTIADILLTTVRQYKRYGHLSSDLLNKGNWLRNVLEIMVDYAYFIPNKTAKTSKVPLPPISDSSRKMFQERLSSCLTRLFSIDLGPRSFVPTVVVGLIRSKAASNKTQDLAFKADSTVMETVEKAFHTVEGISAKGSIVGNAQAAEGFILLYTLTLIQVFNGDGDAVMMLEDIDSSLEALSKTQTEPMTQGQDAFIEIVLSFVGNQRALLRKIAEEAFAIFASEITADGLQSLTDILDTKENLEGQSELFQQNDDEVESAHSNDDEEELDSDVEMVDDESDDSEMASSSDNESDEDEEDAEEEEDEELTQFDNLLAMTLQTSKPAIDGTAADEESSEESDMDDEQMMALDPHLTKIFQQRKEKSSKSKERKDAKQNVVQFKSRVLDLLAIYMERQYSDALTLGVLLPILRRTRANASKQLGEKSAKILKTHFDSRTKHKAPLPQPADVSKVWETLSEIHEEAKLGGGAMAHATSCSNASLHVAKILMALDRSNYAGIMDRYAETQKQWFMDKNSAIQPVLFTQFQNWSTSARK